MTTSSVNNTDDWTKFYNQLENQAVNNYTNQAKQAKASKPISRAESTERVHKEILPTPLCCK